MPEDFAQALARTRDGYLWIGTSGGLVRFDGVRFAVFNRENQPAFRDDSFYSLFVSRDGTLWGGAEGGGLVRYKNGRFRVFGVAEGLTNGFVRVIFEDKGGNLWVGTDRGLFRMRQESLTRIDGAGGIPNIGVHSICEDREGRLLVGGSGLLILSGHDAAYYTSSEIQADNSIRTIRQTSDGAIWIGTISGLRRLENGISGNPFRTRRLISGVNISVLLEAASSAQEISPKISNELLDRARNEVRGAVDEARLAVWNLRESSGSGEDLVKAVSQLAYRTEREMGIPVKFKSSGPPLALGAEGEWSLLIIIREALQNSVRHAAPKNISVLLSFDRRSLRVEIEDDGCGFDPSITFSSNGRHYGLIGMRERVERLGGELRLTSSSGKGTQVRLSIPLARPAPLESR